MDQSFLTNASGFEPGDKERRRKRRAERKDKDVVLMNE
jgi:hypothetical protein